MLVPLAMNIDEFSVGRILCSRSEQHCYRRKGSKPRAFLVRTVSGCSLPNPFPSHLVVRVKPRHKAECDAPKKYKETHCTPRYKKKKDNERGDRIARPSAHAWTRYTCRCFSSGTWCFGSGSVSARLPLTDAVL